MRVVQVFESSTGPVAVNGHTISLVSRTRAVSVRIPAAGVFHIRARPSHVEVLDGDGHRHVIRVHDLQRIVTATIVATAAALVVGSRLSRRTK